MLSRLDEYPYVDRYKTCFVKCSLDSENNDTNFDYDTLHFMSLREVLVLKERGILYEIIETVISSLAIRDDRGLGYPRLISFKEFMLRYNKYKADWEGHGVYEQFGKADVNFDIVSFPDNLDVHYEFLWNQKCFLVEGRIRIDRDHEYDLFLISLSEYYKYKNVYSWIDDVVITDYIEDVVMFNVCYQDVNNTATHKHPEEINDLNLTRDYVKPSSYGKLYKLEDACDKYFVIVKKLLKYYSNRKSIRNFCSKAIDNIRQIDNSKLKQFEINMKELSKLASDLEKYYRG